MDILERNQYNQGIGKYKVLSSTAGVGSIIQSRMGFSVLISDMCQWGFIKMIQKSIKIDKDRNLSENEIYENVQCEIRKNGLRFIDDQRFVRFLKKEKDIQNLVCLINIPEMSLNDKFNTPDWKNHPINRHRQELGNEGRAETYMVKGTHFPKWFKNKKGELKLYSEWRKMWPSSKMDNFVPPRDYSSPIIHSGVHFSKNSGNRKVKLYEELKQLNMVLICPNGHLSDIPWPKYLFWKKNNKNIEDKGEYLFSGDDCCHSSDLKWTENTTKASGYGSIYLECKNCKSKVSLEGINNIKPYCPGQKPWEIELGQDNGDFIPYEECLTSTGEQREQMQIALVTGNNVYYANGFSSLYIPSNIISNLNNEIERECILINKKFTKRVVKKQGLTKEIYWGNLDKEDILCNYDLSSIQEKKFISNLERKFLGLEEDNGIDFHEEYRWEEYQCFVNNNKITEKGLICNDINLSIILNGYFQKIVQIENLIETQVQLDFTRKEPKQRLFVNNEIIESTEGKNIFSIEKDDLYVLPANEVKGEGIFFQFRDDILESWVLDNKEELDCRYTKFFKHQPDLTSQGANIKQRIYNNKFKHFVIHTFSHLLMRELEFSCGYPTSSLKERLYISERMSGVIIYTAEGAEGSMGGLVWQGQNEKIGKLISKAMNRALDCSSDPLCWESDGQGIFDLNLAGCFSCTLVSETACEEMNLGLDRRALVDSEFGFFKNIL